MKIKSFKKWENIKILKQTFHLIHLNIKLHYVENKYNCCFKFFDLNFSKYSLSYDFCFL